MTTTAPAPAATVTPRTLRTPLPSAHRPRLRRDRAGPSPYDPGRGEGFGWSGAERVSPGQRVRSAAPKAGRRADSEVAGVAGRSPVARMVKAAGGFGPVTPGRGRGPPGI